MSSMELATQLGAGFWWLLTVLLIGAFGIHALIMLYHWFGFSMNKSLAILVSIIYFSVGGILILLLLGSLTAII
jgi:hypothetical protein